MRYRQGTSTRTEKKTLLEVDVVDTDAPLRIASGMDKLEIPADTMHSFEATNNKIVWTLEVRGAVRFWPDVKESFKVVVLPRPPEEDPPR